MLKDSFEFYYELMQLTRNATSRGKVLLGHAIRTLTACILLVSQPLLSAQDAGFRLELRIFPQEASLRADGEIREPSGQSGYYRVYEFPQRPGLLRFEADGYIPRVMQLDEQLPSPADLELKLERSGEASAMLLLGELDSGSSPKSVEFSPDGQRMFVAQLSGSGIDIYRLPEMAREGQLRLDPPGDYLGGYVEFAVRRESGELWISQMTTAEVHVVDLENLEVQQAIPTGGAWSKVICFTPDERFAFVSNWLSGDISVIDAEARRLLGRIPVGSVPRGLAVEESQRRLFVTDYEQGRVLSYSLGELNGLLYGTGMASYDAIAEHLANMKPDRTLSPGPGAKRHIVISTRRQRIYVSDMMHGSIFVYNLADLRLLAEIPVGPKLNTIALDPREEFLYISSRGRNNPESYLIAGPDFGRVYVMDAQSLEIVDWVWGGNQPTGLAVSPDGSLLAFTDFLDERLELYDISRYSAVNPWSLMWGRLRAEIFQGLHSRDELPPAVELIEKQPEARAARR